MISPPNFYNANIILLKEYHPQIWQQISDAAPEPTGSLCLAQNGSLNLIVANKEGREVSLHKKSNPESEADDFLAKVPTDHTGFVAMLGMGLGYAPLGILKQRPLLQYLAVFERDTGIFIQSLKHMDLSTLLSDKRLILGIGKKISVSDVLAPASRTLQLEGSSVFHHLPSFDFDPAGYQALKKQLFTHLNSLNVGGTTTRVLGKNFFNNRFRHVTTIHHHLLLEQLRNAFAGIPAILVAGGPSLDKNIHLLKEAQDKAVILAVDTVLPALLKNGVMPHFLTSIDQNNLTYEKFADVIPKAKNISLICSSWVNPKTTRNFPAEQVFWTFTAKPMEAWLNSLLGGKIFTGGASTVAHLNLIATDILGCDPIIFVGQDLAYPQTASHAKGTVLQGTAPTDTLQPNNTEGQIVKGIDGTTLRTNRSFLSMKKFFESAIAQSHKKYINATEGGAHIEGTTVLCLRDVLDSYCTKETAGRRQIQELIQSAKKIDPYRLLDEFGKTLKKVKNLQKDISEADKLSKSVQKEMGTSAKNKQYVRSFNLLPSRTQQKIKKIDSLHNKLDNSVGIWRILEEITMDGLQQSERDRQAISTLANDPAKYFEWLQQNLIRLLNINKVRKETLDLLAENLSRILSFHQKENSLLNKIAKGEDTEQNRLTLARLYMEEENYSLAKPILEKLQTTMPQSGEIFFFLGCIKALRSELAKSAECFSKALSIDPGFAETIDNFHKKLGDEFLSFAGYFKTHAGRQASVKYMVQKGLGFTPNHRQLINELEEIINKDIRLSRSSQNTGNDQDAAVQICDWYNFLKEEKALSANLNPELVSNIYLHYGRLQVKKGRQAEAIANFHKGLEYFPHSYDLNSTIIDTLFEIGDFSNAIESLNKAVTIDNKFAAYWETIGDSLQANGQNEDAGFAYERCFMLQPENNGLLKKIGDCYMAGGQLEAAKEAYQQLKARMEELGASTNDVHNVQ